MQEGHLLRGGFQQQEGVVLHGHVPEVGRNRSLHLVEVAQEPACKVDQVHALVDELSAAGMLRLCTPLRVITDPAAMPVACPHEEERTERAGVDQTPGLAEGAVIAMIESNTHTNAVSRCKL